MVSHLHSARSKSNPPETCWSVGNDLPGVGNEPRNPLKVSTSWIVFLGFIPILIPAYCTSKIKGNTKPAIPQLSCPKDPETKGSPFGTFAQNRNQDWKTKSLNRDPYIIHLNIATCKWRPFLLLETATCFKWGPTHPIGAHSKTGLRSPGAVKPPDLGAGVLGSRGHLGFHQKTCPRPQKDGPKNEDLGCWAVGLLGGWVVGLLGCWVVGRLGCWVVGQHPPSWFGWWLPIFPL